MALRENVPLTGKLIVARKYACAYLMITYDAAMQCYAKQRKYHKNTERPSLEIEKTNPYSLGNEFSIRTLYKHIKNVYDFSLAWAYLKRLLSKSKSFVVKFPTYLHRLCRGRVYVHI